MRTYLSTVQSKDMAVVGPATGAYSHSGNEMWVDTLLCSKMHDVRSRNAKRRAHKSLVGGLEHVLFFRGVQTTNQIST